MFILVNWPLYLFQRDLVKLSKLDIICWFSLNIEKLWIDVFKLFLFFLKQWRILRGCMCQCLLCCTRADARSFDEYFDSEDEINIEAFENRDINKLYMAGKVVHICKTRSIYPRWVIVNLLLSLYFVWSLYFLVFDVFLTDMFLNIMFIFLLLWTFFW